MKNTNAIIQSKLSIERTLLANKRTFLAYVRTAIGLIVAGAGLMKFVQDKVWVVIGIIFIILTPVTILVGIIDYLRVKKIIQKEKEALQDQQLIWIKQHLINVQIDCITIR